MSSIALQQYEYTGMFGVVIWLRTRWFIGCAGELLRTTGRQFAKQALLAKLGCTRAVLGSSPI